MAQEIILTVALHADETLTADEVETVRANVHDAIERQRMNAGLTPYDSESAITSFTVEHTDTIDLDE